MRLWIDTDVGTNVDDAVALLVAAAHPSVELVGLSTVGSDPEGRAAVAAGLLAAAGVDLSSATICPGEPGPASVCALKRTGPERPGPQHQGPERPPSSGPWPPREPRGSWPSVL